MKSKIKRIFACFAIMLCCCVGLCACTTEEIKDSTKAGVEATTSVVAVEYSQSLAKNILAFVANNLNLSSYNITTETTTFVTDSENVSSGYIDSYEVRNMTVYNNIDSTIACLNLEYKNVNNSGISYYGKRIYAKLKDTTDNSQGYYVISDVSSDEEVVDNIKTYTKPLAAMDSSDLGYFLSSVTGGMCYGNGVSYIYCEENLYDEYQVSSSLEIKNGVLFGVASTMRNLTSGAIMTLSKTSISYDNLPKAPELPETIQELISDGYVEGNVYSIIDAKFE